MYICHRKRVQGYLRSSLYNYLTQTTPAKSEFSKLISIPFRYVIFLMRCKRVL